jgi:hypothetical protein
MSLLCIVVKHGAMQQVKAEQLNIICDAGNFGKICCACGKYAIPFKEYIINNCTL